MIQAFYDLGRALADDDHYASYFSAYENPFAAGKKLGDDIVIYFPIDERGEVGTMDFVGFSADQAERYLFLKPSGSNGAPIVATGPFYPESDLEDDKKRAKHHETVDRIVNRIARSIPKGRSTYFPDEASRQAGLAEVERQLKAYAGTPKNRYIYTFKVKGKWPGEIKELRELLNQEADSKFYQKSSSANKTCAVSGKAEQTVWGRVDTLGFTVNDRAFNRGGFDPKHSYRMFPVSAESTAYLEAARRYAFTKLSGSFHPIQYVIIPRHLTAAPENLLEPIEMVARISKEATLGGQVEKALLPGNQVFEEIAVEKKLNRNGQVYDLLFFHRNQAQTALDLYLQDISPGQITHLIKAKNAVNRYYGRTFGSGRKDELKFFHFSLATAKRFFVEGFGANIRLTGAFYRLLEALFYGDGFPQEILLDHIMRTVRKSFKNRNEEPFWFFDVYRAIALLTYLDQLHHLNAQLHTPMDNTPTTSLSGEMPAAIQAYLDEHAGYYASDKPALRGAFLVGILTGMLTYAQYKALGSKPFLNRLNNLSLNVDELQALVPKVYDKILAYQDRTTTKKLLRYGLVNALLADATDLLTRAEKADAKASRDQVSFAFTSGLVLQQKLGLDRAAQASAEAEE